MATSLTLHKDRAAWLAARRQGLGASDAPSVLGVGFRGPMEVFADKVGAELREHSDPEIREWGNRLEPLVAEAYTEKTGHKVERRPFLLAQSADRPWMLCSPDGVIESLGALFEAKTAGAHTLAQWEDEPPLSYLVQAQHGMAVMEVDLCILAVLIGGQLFKHYEIKRNPDFIDQLVRREEVFWGHVERREPPAIDGSEATRAALRALYPRERPGLQVVLPAEAVSWDVGRQEALAAIKHWQIELGQYDNLLRHSIGEGETAVLPNGIEFTYRASERKGYTVEPSVVRTLRRKEPKA